MKFKFLKTVYLSALMAISSFANAGLMAESDVVIDHYTVSYIEFLLTDTGSIDWSLTGQPDGSDTNANSGIHYYLFEGIFGDFGSVLAHNNGSGQQKDLNINLGAGIFTFAVGTNWLEEGEARTGNASTPYGGTQRYSYALEGSTLQVNVPEPSTLAIFALGLIGFASRRFNKSS